MPSPNSLSSPTTATAPTLQQHTRRPSSPQLMSDTHLSGAPSSALSELFNVILHAQASAVREYILKAGCDVELQNDKGDTALLLAARRGDLEVVEALLDTPVSFLRTGAGRPSQSRSRPHVPS